MQQSGMGAPLGYGPAPQGPYGSPQHYPPPGYVAQPPASPKKSNVLLWVFVVFAGLVIVGAIAGAVGYFLLSKPGPHLAKYLPKDTTLYVEVPSVKRSAIAAAGIKPIDSSRVSEKQMMDDTVSAMATSFTISPDDARAVLGSVDALAFAGRDLNKKGDAAVVFQFSSGGAAEKLLKSVRFTSDGPFGSGGTRYKLERNKARTLGSKRTFVEEAFDEMSATGSARERLVWFPKNKLLVFGDEDIVTDIGRAGAGTTDSLEKSDAYGKAKKTFESGSDVTFFYDTTDLEDHNPKARKLMDAWLKDRDPITGAIKIVKAGVMMDTHVTLSGTAMPPDDLLPPLRGLTYPRKLPTDTIAYMAFSTKTKMTGAAVRSLAIQRTADQDPAAGKELKDSLDDLDKELGFKLDDVIDMTGDECVMALLVDPTLRIDGSDGPADELGKVGVLYAMAVKDDAKAKAILGKLRAKIEGTGVVSVRTLPDGFEVDPKTPAAFPLPNLTVKDDGKQIIVIAAAPAMTGRALDALQANKGTLAGDKAHEAALATLPKDSALLMWIDVGRVTSLLIDGKSRVSRKAAAAAELPLDAVRLTGDDRVTAAFAVRESLKKGSLSVDMDSLNMPALSMFSVAKDVDVAGLIPGGPMFEP